MITSSEAVLVPFSLISPLSRLSSSSLRHSFDLSGSVGSNVSNNPPSSGGRGGSGPGGWLVALEEEDREGRALEVGSADGGAFRSRRHVRSAERFIGEGEEGFVSGGGGGVSGQKGRTGGARGGRGDPGDGVGTEDMDSGSPNSTGSPVFSLEYMLNSTSFPSFL